jgi:hypothetical protein
MNQKYSYIHSACPCEYSNNYHDIYIMIMEGNDDMNILLRQNFNNFGNFSRPNPKVQNSNAGTNNFLNTGPYKEIPPPLSGNPENLFGQGFAVSMSGDGKTLAIGMNDRANGGVYIFINNNGTWTQQGPRLQSTDLINAGQGLSVSLSYDGNSLVSGAPLAKNDAGVFIGATVVFHRDNDIWTQMGSPLVGSGGVGRSFQGISVAISQDASTIAVGGNGDDSGSGAVWIWIRNGNTWIQNGQKLVGSGGSTSSQGSSVALSANGKILAEGGTDDTNLKGAVWIFKKKEGVWTQDGDKLVGKHADGASRQGTSVSLNKDGNILAVGASGFLQNIGAVFIFIKGECGWKQFGHKISEPTPESAFGQSVSLDQCGKILAVGAPFADSGTTAIYKREKKKFVLKQILKGSGALPNQNFGIAVSLSARGKELAIGGPSTVLGQGKTWIFQKVNDTK